MTPRNYRSTGRAALIAVVMVFGAPAAHAEPIFAVTAGTQRLVTFDSATPGTLTNNVVITGLQAGEVIVGIDVRPLTGQLYALGSTSRLYVIDPATGAATQVGASGAFTLSGTAFGFDFNPTVDRIRVTSDADQNLRLNPDTGALTATDGALTYAVGDPNFGTNASVVGSAYTNNFAGAMTTTLYAIDFNLDLLATQNPPNSGTLNSVGPLGVNTTELVGFDISGSSGVAFASLTSALGVSQLYTINLSTGASTLIGTPGTLSAITGIAVASVPAVPEPSTVLLLAAGLAMLGRRRLYARR